MRLAVAHLEHEPASRPQHLERAPGDRLGRALPDERHLRLELPHVRHQRLELGRLDVRRVRHDELVRPSRQALPQVVLEQLELESRPLGVLARQRERVGRDVDRGDARARVLVGDRQRDRARAGADVEDARSLEAAQVRERPLDDDLRLRPRDQRAAVDRQREPPEAPLAEDVGDGLVPRAAGDELAIGGELGLAQRPVEVGVELDPRPAEHVREQQLGVEAPGLGGLAEVLCTRAGAPRPGSASRRSLLEPVAPVFLLQRRREVVQPALQHLVEAQRHLDPVVGRPAVRIVVRADLLGPLARADLRPARGGELRLLALALGLVDAAPAARASP